jgi:hypothetical protein
MTQIEMPLKRKLNRSGDSTKTYRNKRRLEEAIDFPFFTTTTNRSPHQDILKSTSNYIKYSLAIQFIGNSAN